VKIRDKKARSNEEARSKEQKARRAPVKYEKEKTEQVLMISQSNETRTWEKAFRLPTYCIIKSLTYKGNVDCFFLIAHCFLLPAHCLLLRP
jgi:hypothetical protein